MTNIIPRAPQHNQEAWASLEEYTRDLVRAGREVYVIMGSYGAAGTGSKGPAQTIAAGRITLPKRIWKVIVVPKEGENDGPRISPDTRFIAVDTPNGNGVTADWDRYRITVDAIKQATGYDLLSNVPAAVQQVVEARTDAGPTQ